MNINWRELTRRIIFEGFDFRCILDFEDVVFIVISGILGKIVIHLKLSEFVRDLEKLRALVLFSIIIRSSRVKIVLTSN